MNEFLKFLRLQIKIYSSIPSQWLQNEMKKKDSYNILFLHVLNFFLKNWRLLDLDRELIRDKGMKDKKLLIEQPPCDRKFVPRLL